MNKDLLLEMLNNGMSMNDISKKESKSATSVRYWCKKYGLKSNYTPIKNSKSKHKCGMCGETNPEKFYGHKKSVCGKCHNGYTLELGQKKREFIINTMGGKCISCGYDKYSSALHVHHIDSSKKDPKFANIRCWSENRILDEIRGCVLLCACCHSAVHANQLILPNVA